MCVGFANRRFLTKIGGLLLLLKFSLALLARALLSYTSFKLAALMPNFAFKNIIFNDLTIIYFIDFSKLVLPVVVNCQIS